MDNDAVLQDLLDREPIFHRRHHGTSRTDLEGMMAPDFFEIGASGTVYTRQEVIETCLERYKTPENLLERPRHARVRRLADDLWQFTYDLQQGVRLSRRSTLWRHCGKTWQIVFHQGTVIT
jgi:hypothetical protein